MSRALTSASNLFRRELCPGSAAAEDGLREEADEDSEDSKEGTMLHALMADPSLDRSHLNGEQLDVIRIAEDSNEKIFGAILKAKGLSDDEPFIEGVEQDLWLFRGIRKVLSGHCDKWRYYASIKLLIILDYKFGRREVMSAEANVQLMCYGVMGVEDRELGLDVDHLMVAINQPRLEFAKRVTIGEYSREQIPVAKDRLLAIFDGAHEANGTPRADVPRVAGEEQCRYCLARLHCDAYRAKFAWLAQPAADGVEQFIGKLVREADPHKIDMVFQATKFAMALRDSNAGDPLKKLMLRMIEQGSLPMYETKATGNTSTITDPARARELLIEHTALTADEIDDRARHSLDSLSEVLRLKTGMTAKDAKLAVKKAVERVLDVKPKAPSLKRIEGWKGSLPEGTK